MLDTRILNSLLPVGVGLEALVKIAGATILVVGSLSIAYVIVYRIFFHPLAEFNGPLLAKFSNLYAAYHAWKGDIHVDIWRCHQKYGDRIRYGPDRIVINTPRALQDIYGHGAPVKKYDGYNVLASQAPNLLTLSDKAQHSRRRRVISQAFSEGSLKLFEPVLVSRIHRFCATLRNEIKVGGEWSKPLDMTRQFSYLTFDSMTAVAFGVDYNALQNPQFRYVMEMIQKANVRLSVMFQTPGIGFGRLDRKLFPDSTTAGYTFAKFLRRLLKTRLADENGSKDIFWFLQQCQDPDTGLPLTTKELSTETATFLVAGSDTTSTTMSALSHYLAACPEYYKQVIEEIRSTFVTKDEICLGPKLNSCVFLRACIDEALRLSPPGGASFWREVETGGARIGDDFFPEGTLVGVGIYAIHHHADFWEEPFTFKPKRWLRKSMTESKLPYSPFGHGPRSCIGKPLAINQLMLTFALIFWEFDFRKSSSTEARDENGIGNVEYELKEHISGHGAGPLLCFRAQC
ncbi:cytochrome P450 [Xylaria telfairii]|nr:cytochrome P450 [Xylaria telfairii]